MNNVHLLICEIISVFKKDNVYYPDGNPLNDKDIIKSEYVTETGTSFYIAYTEKQINKQYQNYFFFFPYTPWCIIDTLLSGKPMYVEPMDFE